jgi:hypothetical protein
MWLPLWLYLRAHRRLLGSAGRCLKRQQCCLPLLQIHPQQRALECNPSSSTLLLLRRRLRQR